MSTAFKAFFSVIIALLYSVSYVVAGPMADSQSFVFRKSMILPFLICFVICSAVNYLVFSFVPKLRFEKFEKRFSGAMERLGDRRFFFIVWAFIFVMWIPAFLILYPGVLSYDAISQTGSALSVIDSNHHPVLHTFLIRVFMNFGQKCLSSYEVGIGFMSLLQMVILSYALARLVLLLKVKKVPLLLVFVSALLSALWFTNAVLSVTMIKDTLHAAFLILFVCHFTEIVTSPSEYVSHKINYVLLPVVSFFMCAFRNNGLHIYLFCFAGLALLRIARVKSVKSYAGLIAVILLPVILFKLYSGPFFDAIGIKQGEVREALSVPIQQLQRVSSLKYNELTEEQREIMRSYIIDCPAWMGYENNRAYEPFCADPAKSCFYSAYYESTSSDFWKFYLKTGAQFSKAYVEAFLSNSLGYWYPKHYPYSYVMYDNYEPEMFAVPLTRHSLLNVQWLKDCYYSFCLSDFWRDLPGVRFFFVPGFSLWIVLFSIVLSWTKKGYFTHALPLLLPLIAQFGIMILCPIASFRYSWPLYLMLPIVLVTVFGKINSEE